MKTEDLLQLLAADQTNTPPPRRVLLRSMLPALLVAFALFMWFAGWRDDLGQQFGNPRLAFKVLINAALAIVAAGLLLDSAGPVARPGPWRSALAGLLVLVMAGIGVELLLLPREDWWAAARGQNATWCLRLIPLLALAPLVAGLYTLRNAAPAQPLQAGAAAGLLAASLGGMLYALHCPDDSPLFVALWYGIATLVVSTAGALAGRRLLRW